MRILIADDHPEVRQSIAAFLVQLGHQVLHADDGAAALTQAEGTDLILSDLRMPGMDGLELLSRLEELDHPPPLALMTAFGEANSAIEAMRRGAIDYLRKPIDIRELHRLVERVGTTSVTHGVPILPSEEADGLVVAGEEMVRLVALADRLHQAIDLPCLIEGETGAGKELFARRIHHGGEPDARPFVALNCAAIASGLFEADLFGHVAGAFTGAAPGGSPGKLALAAGGTLFLDEIGDLPLDQQAKLLRLLEDRAWYPVGGVKLEKLRARVVCATNVRLLQRVREGRFREDLYYRLKVGHLRVPPLRERHDAIIPLTLHFLMRIRRQRGRGFQRLSSAAEQALLAYAWPGNVRQLYHLLEQVCAMHDGAVLDVTHLSDLTRDASATERRAVPKAAAGVVPGDPPPGLRIQGDHCDLDAWLKALIVAALEANDGSPVRTATFLRISRKVLYTLRKRYDLLGREDDAP